MRSLPDVIAEAKDAVVHGDAGPAWNCLRELVQIEHAGAVSQSDPGFLQLKSELRYTALPMLPLDDVSNVLSREILNLLQQGVDLDDRLSVRYAFTTYGDHEAERQMLRQAILANQEVVGGKALGAWLQEFDKAYDPMTRDNRHIYDFLSKNRQLQERDRAILNIILTAYENWLATERLNIYDLAYLKDHPEIAAQAEARQSGAGPYASAAANKAYQDSRAGSGKKSMGVVKLPLLKALADYPRVGEQMVTSDKIRLKGQPDPQRPTLANWIRCYRDELGVGMHDQVTRGRFLFQSENGKRLSTQDRDRINLIIKSLEEEFPLDVDTDRMQILFAASAAPAVQAPATAAASKLTFPSAPQAAPERPVRPYTPPAQPASAAPAPVTVGAGKGSFLGATFGAAKNVAGDTLHFSTGHVLPGEKGASAPVAPTPLIETKEQDAAPYPMTGINRSPGTPLRNPYSIRPLRLRNTALDRESDAR